MSPNGTRPIRLSQSKLNSKVLLSKKPLCSPNPKCQCTQATELLDPRKRTFQVCFIAAATDPLRLRSTSTALTVAAPVRASDLQRDLTRSSDPHWEVQVRGSSSGCRPCHARHNSASGPGLPALLSGLAPGPPGRNVSVLLAADRRLSVQLCFVSKYTTRLVLVA